MEEWRIIAEYEGVYEVSSLGRIRSVSRTVARKDGRTNTYSARIMEPFMTHRGYLRISLCRNGKHKRHFVHRLVASAFLDAPASRETQVNHIDGIKTNNATRNLEWVTPEENMAHASRIGLIKKAVA